MPVKLSQLAPAAALDGSEAVPLVQAGATRRTTVAALRAGLAAAAHAHGAGDVAGLAAVAYSGDWADLSGRPAVPALSDEAPAALAGSAAAGAAAAAARADHAHPLPSLAALGLADDRLWQTGDYKHTARATPPPGWVFADGRTIGGPGSGASSRANADAQALFALLWGDYPQIVLPVSGGRGASAAADFAAGKTIALPDLRGRLLLGRDDMGGAAANRVTASGAGNPGIAATQLGASGGADRHALAAGQVPAHAHGLPAGIVRGNGGGSIHASAGVSMSVETGLATASAGGGEAHPQVPPVLVCNVLIRL
jgi:microcystin-dependent protein